MFNAICTQGHAEGPASNGKDSEIVSTMPTQDTYTQCKYKIADSTLNADLHMILELDVRLVLIGRHTLQ